MPLIDRDRSTIVLVLADGICKAGDFV